MGMLVGALIMGRYADRAGRRLCMAVCGFVLAAGGVLGAVAPNATFYAAARFLTGLGDAGVQLSCFVLVLENVSPEWTAPLGILLSVPHAIGDQSVIFLDLNLNFYITHEVLFRIRRGHGGRGGFLHASVGSGAVDERPPRPGYSCVLPGFAGESALAGGQGTQGGSRTILEGHG
jgi:MFS family permease